MDLPHQRYPKEGMSMLDVPRHSGIINYISILWANAET